MPRCIAFTAPLAIIAIVFFMGLAPSHTWVATQPPVIAGWIGLAIACRVSQVLLGAVHAGTMTVRRARVAMLPLIVLFPALVGAASVLGLAITDALGIYRVTMSGLQPYIFGLGALVLAIVAFGVHALRMKFPVQALRAPITPAGSSRP